MRSSRSLALARALGSQPGRVSLVRMLSSQAREGWRLLPSGLRVRHVKSGELGDDPVDVGQTVRVQYSARLEDGREVVSKLVASFRVGGGGVCAAIGGACSAYQLAMAARRALSVAGIFWPVSSET